MKSTLKSTVFGMLANLAGYVGIWIAGLGFLALVGGAYIWTFAHIGQ